jgi:hypothetical protein
MKETNNIDNIDNNNIINNNIDNNEEEKIDNSFSSNSDFFILNDIKDENSKKKQLIQSKIINEKYELKHFEDFCNSRKKVNGNIYLFSLKELELLIQDFVKYHTPHPNSGINGLSGFINNKLCKKIEKSIINDKQIKITITNPKEIKTSFYQQNYTNYEVHTDLTLWKVNRRYSDFIWLRENLIKFYPGIYCPPIPEKKPGPARLEDKFIEKRRLFLTQFINDLARIEIFKSSDVLIDFLSVQDRDRFDRKKEEYNSKKVPILLEDNLSFTGNVNLMEDCDKLDNYFNNIENYLDTQMQIFGEMKTNLNSYYNNINEAYLNLCNVEKNFDLLSKLNKKYSVKEGISKTYYELWKFFKNYKSIQYEQNDIIKRNIKRFFKYISMESQAFLELIEKRKEYKDNYKDKNSKLLDKKEKLWKDKNLNNWEIENINDSEKLQLFNDKNYAFNRMCTSETKDLNNTFDWLCYLNYTVNDQFKIFINKQSNKFFANIKNFSEEFKNNLNKFVESWSDIVSLVIVKK